MADQYDDFAEEGHLSPEEEAAQAGNWRATLNGHPSYVVGGGITDPVIFCTDIATKDDFIAACWSAQELQSTEHYWRFNGDIKAELLKAGLRVGFSKRDVELCIRNPSLFKEFLEQEADSGKTDRGGEGGRKVEPLETISAASFAGKAVRPVRFLDDRHFFPRGMVSVLTGAGAIGKTLVALQLLAGTALRSTWLGQPVNRDGRGVAVFFSAEEPENVIHARLVEIAASEPFDLADLKGFHCIFPNPEKGESAELFVQGDKGQPVVPTSMFHRLAATCENLKPDLLVIDNRAQTVLANENDRIVAQRTMAQLAILAARLNMAIVLLAHPSLVGLNTGTGNSGSTGWWNGSRSFINMQKGDGTDDAPGADDDGKRMLTRVKANHAPSGTVINVKRELGCFRCTDKPERAGADIGQADKVERIFITLLKVHTARGDHVSSKPSARNYAPTIFAGHPAAEKCTPKMFKRAMENLFSKEAITAVEYGPPSKKTWRLEVAKCNF